MGHTPGPWQAHGWGDAEVEIVGPNDRVICELAQEYDDHSGAGTNAAIDADARLISAAPDLLAAIPPFDPSVNIASPPARLLPTTASGSWMAMTSVGCQMPICSGRSWIHCVR